MLRSFDITAAVSVAATRRIGLRLPLLALAMGAAFVVAPGYLKAQPTPAVQEAAAEKPRVRIDFGSITISYVAPAKPALSGSLSFLDGDSRLSPRIRRSIADLANAMPTSMRRSATLLVLVHGDDEALAYKRARAVRGELVERHDFDPSRILAAAFEGGATSKASQDGITVDLIAVEHGSCTGCGDKTFRTLAYDSAALKLVRAAYMDAPAPSAKPQAPVVAAVPPVPAAAQPASPATVQLPAADALPVVTPLPEGVPAGRTLSDYEANAPVRSAQAEPVPSARPDNAATEARVPAPAPVQAAPVPEVVVPLPPAPRPAVRDVTREPKAPVQVTQPRRAPDVVAQPQRPVDSQLPRVREARVSANEATGCPKPRIIIDDYYPGGPIIPCRRRAR